jgi:glycosyltransferase involved in cell wall biosynthesis
MARYIPPIVSVVIPVYNGERYLAQAIQSVLEQTYKNFELIVVDDGSTDGSAATAKSFEDARLRYHYQKNGGASKARNTGIELARGGLIAFLDSDDVWLPQKLEKQIAYLEAHNEIGAVYCWYRVLAAGESREIWKGIVSQDPFGIITAGYGLLPSITMFRREVLNNVKGFDEDLIGSEFEDRELTLRLCEITKFTYLPEPLVLYRSPEWNPKISRAHLHNRGVYLQKCLDRYRSDPRIVRVLYREMVGHWSDLGKAKLILGKTAEGRRILFNALRLSLERRTNAKMFVRTLRRLIRSYF